MDVYTYMYTHAFQSVYDPKHHVPTPSLPFHVLKDCRMNKTISENAKMY